MISTRTPWHSIVIMFVGFCCGASLCVLLASDVVISFFTRPAVGRTFGRHTLALDRSGVTSNLLFSSNDHLAMSSHLSGCFYCNNILSKAKQTGAFKLARNCFLSGCYNMI